MIGKILFLATLALTAARPSDESAQTNKDLWEPSDLCPPIHNHYLLPHEYDCSKFYYCEYGLKYIDPTSCANGTVFSYEEQVCVHSWAYNCKLPGTPTVAPTQAPSTTPATVPPTQPPSTAPPTQATTQAPVEILPNGCPANSSIHHLLPHEECDKFYQCVFGKTVEKRCAPGTYFNYEIQVCDWPANVDTSNCKLPVTTTVAPTEAPSSTPTQAPSTAPPTAAPTQATTQAPIEILPNGCPANSSIHHLLPHEECDKFYQCVFGETVEMRCAPGTYFNYEIQVCDWPANVDTSNCKLPVTTTVAPTEAPSSTPTQAPSTAPPTAPPTQATTQAPIEILPNGCPANSSIHHLLPHEECDKFYQCVFGETVEMRCAPGTYFNYEIQVCDWPANVDTSNCKLPVTTTVAPTEAPSSTPTQAPSTAPPTAPPTQATTQAPIEILPNGCPANSSIHHLLPHEECDKFYQCVFGKTVEMRCAPGTYFNYEIQVCDWPANVDTSNCKLPVTTTVAPTQAPSTASPTAPPTQATTQAPVEILPNGCPANSSIHHLLPHEECDKFYQCVFGETVEMRCAPGTYFNYEIQVCDWPANVECVSGGDNGSGDNGGGNNGGDNGGGENGGDENGGNNDDICKNECNVLPWSHATECDKFWSCDGEKSALNVCSFGLHFNANTLTCDFICNAGCLTEKERSIECFN